MRIQITAFAAVLFTAASAQAAGFKVGVHGAKGTARGHAYTADPKDASAIYHNVGALGRLKGLQLQVGGSLIAPDQSYDGPEGRADLQTSIVPTPHVYGTYQVVDGVTIGLGMNPPYGSGLEWGPESPGRQIVREISLRTFFITSAMGIDLDTLGIPGLAVGAGLDLIPASAYLWQDILFGPAEVGQAELSGDDFAVGGRVGVVYNPPFAEDLHLGVAYRLGAAFNFSGEADFDAPDYLRDQLPVDGPGSVELELPAALRMAVAYDFTENLQIEVNVNYDQWNVYDDLVLNLPPNADGTETEPTIFRRSWEDTWSFRVGAEWAEETWALRAGYEYDPTPVPDDTLDFSFIGIDRNALSGGGSLQLTENIGVDASIWYLLKADRQPGPEPFQPPLKGTYETSAFVASLSLNFTWGASPINGLVARDSAPASTENTSLQ